MAWLKLKVSDLLSFIFLFLLIFDLKIFGSVGSAVLVFFGCFIYILANPKIIIEKSKRVISAFDYFLIAYLFLILFVLLRLMFSGGDDISYLLTMIKSTSILLAMFSYLLVFYDDNILEKIVNVFFVNGIFCLFFGTFYEYKPLITVFQYGEEVFGLIGDSEYRTAFLAGSGYFGISSLYSVAFAIALYVTSNKPTILNFIKILVIAIAGVLAGRVALVCYFLCIAFFSIRKMSLIYLLGGLFFFCIGYYLLNNVDYFYNANAWIMEMFGGKIEESNSIMDLKTMFFIPETTTLLLGDGKYGGMDTYYGGTDVGYMRNLLFGGAFYMFLVVIVSFLLVYKVKSNFIILVIFFIALFLHFKAVFLINNPGFFGLFGLVVFYFYNKKKYFMETR